MFGKFGASLGLSLHLQGFIKGFFTYILPLYYFKSIKVKHVSDSGWIGSAILPIQPSVVRHLSIKNVALTIYSL